jgi:four helix bundle protein
MRQFRDINVWQRAYKLALTIYKLSADFPKEGLTSQLRRAASSVSINIAEGSRRKTDPDFAKFLNIAEGSLAETDCLLMFVKDLGLASSAQIEPIAQELNQIERMLFTLRNKLEAGSNA